ncbi:hypothetical protein ACFMI3_17140, partial [Acinetobacter baumannii]
FCVGPHEFHIDGALRRYYSGSIDITYNQKDRYFLVGEKKKVKCKACKGFGFIRDDGWGHIDKCEICFSPFHITARQMRSQQFN